jgi:radical SAM superfamily enzyme YgiQ (UPF0313 family)
MKKIKVLLATPVATAEELWGQYKDGAGAYMPLGLLSIAGVSIKSGFNVKICDASTLGMSKDEFADYLKAEKFDVIGLGNCYTALAHLVFATAKICRKILPDCKIVLGGIHPTLFPSETLKACPEAEFVVFCEGEYTFRELLEFIQAGRFDYENIKGIVFRKDNQSYQAPPRPLIEDLSQLPELMFDLLPVERYVPPPSNYRDLPTYGLLVQRGCPYACVYCDSRIHGKKVRHDGIDKSISQIRYLVEKYGMKGILFHDSAFTIDMDFAKKLCQRLIDEKLNLSWTCYTRVDRINPDLLSLMKKAGCWGVAFGLESGNEESLKIIRKGVTLQQNIEGVRMTKKAGLQVIGSFILCLPGEDEKMVKNTIRFAKKLKLDTVVFFLPVPFPGTELYDICKKEGGLVEKIKWQDYRQWMDQTNPLYVNPKIGKERMVELYNYAVRSFYLSPATILRFLLRIRSFSDAKKYFTGFKSIAKIIKKSFVYK